MLSLIFCLFLVVLTLGGAIFIANGGISMCEGSGMLKVLVGGYFALYAVAAVSLKLLLPTIPATQIDSASLVPSGLREMVTGIDIPAPWQLGRGNAF